MIIKTKSVQQRVHNQKDWPKEYTCNVLEPGLVSYEDVGAGIAMLRKETILKILPSFIGKPVIARQHKDVTPQDFEDHAVGYVTRAWYDDMTNWAYFAFLIIDDKAKRDAENGYSVSCAYDVLQTGPGGQWHAIKYDEEILDGTGTHLALVMSPRYEDCRILMNSKNGTAKVNIVKVSEALNENRKTKQEVKMIQLYRKANDKAGAEVDPKDPAKQKWQSADGLFVKVENEMVPLSELAKCANGFVPVQAVENEIEIDGQTYSLPDLVSAYNAQKAANKKNEDKPADEKKPEEKKEMAKNEGSPEDEKKPEEKKEDAKKNEEKPKEEEEKKAEEKKDNKEADDKNDNPEDQKKEEETIKRNETKKNDVSHFVRLNNLRENGAMATMAHIDTLHSRVDRGVSRYGTSK